MCGRYTVATEDELIEMRAIIEEISIRLSKEKLPTEAYPTVNAPILKQDKEIIISKWGFAKWDNKGTVFNAKSESMEGSRFFSPYLPDGRCIVPARNYFEWEKIGGKTGPKYKIYRQNGKPLFMAGIMRPGEGGIMEYAVITRAAAENIRFIHDRMPLILDESLLIKWLSRDFDRRLLDLPSVPVEYAKAG